MNPSFSPEEIPGLEGPDYVALVIEWDDDDATAVRAQAPAPSAIAPSARKIATIVSALGAIALATWGIRRLRAVS